MPPLPEDPGPATEMYRHRTDTLVDDRGDGPALVLSHGTLMDRTMFRPQQDALADDYRVVAYDNRARTDNWQGPYDLDDPRFVCDLHLGKLARLLRFCGLDTVWDRTLREPGLALLAARQRRTVISRHRALLTRNAVARGLLVRANDADTQLTEVLRRFRLADRITSPGRCTRCNGELEPRHRDQVPVPIPPRTAAWRDRYWLCRDCGHLFWEGTHVARLRARVVRAAAEVR